MQAQPRAGEAWAYFALALGWSTAFWLLCARAGGPAEPPGAWLFLAGGAGPPLAALGLLHARAPGPEVRAFWARLVDPRRIGPRWWAAALLLHPALVALAVGADAALGGGGPAWSEEATGRGAAGYLALAAFVLGFGPLPEELGWRGYALPRLLGRHGALAASLLVGAAWAAWHLPLFFVEGTFQHGLGAGSARFWIFSAALLPGSVLFTWIFVHTRWSTLSAVLFHFSGNLTGALVDKSLRVAALELALLTAAAVGVTAACGPRHLRRGAVSPDGGR